MISRSYQLSQALDGQLKYKSIFSHQYGHKNANQTVIKDETQKGVKSADFSPKWFGWCQGNDKNHRARSWKSPGNALTWTLWSSCVCDFLRLCQSVCVLEGELRSYGFTILEVWSLSFIGKAKTTNLQQSFSIS